MSGLPFFPPQASTIAGQVDLLFLILIGLSSIFTLLVIFLIIYFGIKYRRGTAADRSNPPTTSLKMELSWIGGLLILGVGTYIGATILYLNMFRPQPNSLDIYVLGMQWMWKFQHPAGPSEINTLHMPTDQPVRLVMISEDVIHSFYVPEFRLKYDVIPGRYTSFWVEANQPGEYNIFCTEYCGTDHSRMIGKVIVMEPRSYQEWLSSGGQVGGEQAAASSSTAAQGEVLFQQLGCSSCHTPQGQTAPSLAGLFGQPVPLEDGQTVTADENYLRESILLPQEKIVAGYPPIMPTYQGRVNEEQLLHLVDYIRNLE